MATSTTSQVSRPTTLPTSHRLGQSKNFEVLFDEMIRDSHIMLNPSYSQDSVPRTSPRILNRVKLASALINFQPSCQNYGSWISYPQH